MSKLKTLNIEFLDKRSGQKPEKLGVIVECYKKGMGICLSLSPVNNLRQREILTLNRPEYETKADQIFIETKNNNQYNTELIEMLYENGIIEFGHYIFSQDPLQKPSYTLTHNMKQYISQLPETKGYFTASNTDVISDEDVKEAIHTLQESVLQRGTPRQCFMLAEMIRDVDLKMIYDRLLELDPTSEYLQHEMFTEFRAATPSFK